MTNLYDTITQWPAIVQSALGSALFWLILELLRRAITAVQLRVRSQISPPKFDSLLREYIYKKYTSHSGLAYYPQGYFLTFSHVLQFLLMGMIFFALVLIGGGITQLSLTIGAIYYFSKALIWLIPDRNWRSDTTLNHWKRIAELEQILFGKVDDDTQGIIAKWQDKESQEGQGATRVKS
jgi:hypothetical protein